MKLLKKVYSLIFICFDKIFLAYDKILIRRTRNIRLIPTIKSRRGGKVSYGEWAHVVGIFQTILNIHLPQKSNNHILDVGCGTGIMAIASEPFIIDQGKYIGIDVMPGDIEFCKGHYPSSHFAFEHLPVFNSAYSPDQNKNRLQWDVKDSSIDAVTALSVWTHFNEEDAIFYFTEIDRVLKPNGVAIVTFFLLDAVYYNSLSSRDNNHSKYHMDRQIMWVFDIPCSRSNNWFCPKWAKTPEDAIGLNNNGLNTILEGTGLKLKSIYPGNWKEIPGVFFQDILVFKKGQKEIANI